MMDAAWRVAAGETVACAMRRCRGASAAAMVRTTSSSAPSSLTKIWITSQRSATSTTLPRKFGAECGERLQT